MKKLFLLILLTGCCPSREVIEDRSIVSPVISDTVYVTRIDSLYVEGEKIVRLDTVIQVKYFPVQKKFWIYAKPDTVRYRDTTYITTEIKYTTWDKLKLVAVGLSIGIILLVIIVLKK